LEKTLYNIFTYEVSYLFIKLTKVKDYEYIKLVESYWEDGKSKHRVLFNFGRLDLIKKDESFTKAVKKLCILADIPLKTDMEAEEK